MAKTILIVDDVPFVRQTLTEILTAAHYQVVGEAADGQEAISQYKVLRPDLVTMDVVMPKLGGIDAAKTIIKMDSGARIVIISAMGQESLIMEAINAGAKDYILKPFSAKDVLKTVERALLDESQTMNRSLQKENKA